MSKNEVLQLFLRQQTSKMTLRQHLPTQRRIAISLGQEPGDFSFSPAKVPFHFDDLDSFFTALLGRRLFSCP